MQVFANIILAIILAVSVLLIVGVVLLPPKSEGIGASVGGQDTNIFGHRRAYGPMAIVERMVNWSAVIFMIGCFVYNILIKFI